MRGSGRRNRSEAGNADQWRRGFTRSASNSTNRVLPELLFANHWFARGRLLRRALRFTLAFRQFRNHPARTAKRGKRCSPLVRAMFRAFRKERSIYRSFSSALLGGKSRRRWGRKGGKNWRHSPPRSGSVFRLFFALSSAFVFYSPMGPGRRKRLGYGTGSSGRHRQTCSPPPPSPPHNAGSIAKSLLA